MREWRSLPLNGTAIEAEEIAATVSYVADIAFDGGESKFPLIGL